MNTEKTTYSFFEKPEIKAQIRDAVVNKLSEHHAKVKAEAAKEAESAIIKVKSISAKQASLTKKKAPDGDRFISKSARSNKSKQPSKTYILESYDNFTRPDADTRNFIDKANASNQLVVKRILGTLLEDKNFIRPQDKILVTKALESRIEEFKILFDGLDVQLLSEAR
ncbi:hypothetical protein CQ062_11700 [Ochrobactrum sp. MYb68]|nr:hypothetical protein CQ062_11700 [Ochrobactrum sp. MYb68]